jgi:ribosomal protein L37AE/L43A
MSESEYDAQAAVFEELISQEGNDACVDCGKTHIQWASVSNGVWLCTDCSGRHRGLGVHLSFVRSLKLDKWTDVQLATVRRGGNRRALALWREHRLDGPDVSLQQRYDHPAMVAYRDVLFDEAYAALGRDGPAERQRRADEQRKWQAQRTQPTSISSSSSSFDAKRQELLAARQRKTFCCCSF